MHIDFPFVDCQKMESSVRKSLKREKFFFWVCVAASAWVAWYWFNTFFDIFPYLGPIMIFCFLLGQLPFIESTHLNDTDSGALGNFSKNELEKLVREVCESFNETEIPKIYVVDSKDAGAWVMNVDILNWVRPWNAIYLTRYFLNCLNRQELKALLAHEMCHFSMHYTITTRYFFIRGLCMAILITTLISYPIFWWENFVGDGWVFWIGLICFSFFGITSVVIMIAKIITGLSWIFSARGDSQEVEALCDLEAARRFGMTPMCNVLLKLGTRQEIFQSVISAFHKNPTEKPNSSALLFFENGAVTIATKKLEELLPDGFISNEDATPMIEEAIQTGVNSTQSQRFRHEAINTIRWQDYDNRYSNSNLDLVEFQTFFEEIKKNPDNPLFNIPDEVDSADALFSTHPSIRNRILFLGHNLLENWLVESSQKNDSSPPIYLARGAEWNGPYSKHRIQHLLSNGELIGNELAWHEGLDYWVNVKTIIK